MPVGHMESTRIQPPGNGVTLARGVSFARDTACTHLADREARGTPRWRTDHIMPSETLDRPQLAAVEGAPRADSATAYDLYLDLLKKCLTRYLFPQTLHPINPRVGTLRQRV